MLHEIYAAVLMISMVTATAWLMRSLYLAGKFDAMSAADLFIASYQFPSRLDCKLACQFTQLSIEQRATVWQALRTYFLAIRRCPDRRIEMPSKVVDEAWHMFILETSAYSAFCEQAFGKYLHHHPSGDGSEPTQIRMRTICSDDPVLLALKPVTPAGAALPALFTIDADLGISNGFAFRIVEGRPSQVATVGGSGCSTVGHACGGD